MGRRKDHRATKSQTLPSSPTHSSTSSSDFEFTVALSPRGGSTNSSSYSSSCPADELFYKGQLLPLHLSPRLSMVRTLLLASSSTSSSSDTTTTASRDSTGSSSNDSRSSFSAADLLLLPPDCDSSRPSSAAEETDFSASAAKKTSKYHLNFSLSRFSSVFRKTRHADPPYPHPAGSAPAPSPVKRLSKTAREVIGKYLKKVKPLYEKLSQNQKPQQKTKSPPEAVTISPKETAVISHSFSGNLRYPRRKSCVSSCPSSMRSSPSHSGVLCRAGFTPPAPPATKSAYPSDMSSMEELQNAIQGAIAHCKNSMLQPSTTTATSSHKNIVVSNEI